MSKEIYSEGGSNSGLKESLKKWGIRLGLIAVGLLGLRWILK